MQTAVKGWEMHDGYFAKYSEGRWGKDGKVRVYNVGKNGPYGPLVCYGPVTLLQWKKVIHKSYMQCLEQTEHGGQQHGRRNASPNTGGSGRRQLS